MAPAHHRHQHRHLDVDHDVEAVLARLREDGGRVTTGRRAIVTALFTADDHHVTAESVAELVQAEHPDVHLSTVYRTLDALADLDIVDRVDVGAGPAVYHLTDHPHLHHHLVCEVCGSVTEASDDAVDRLAAELDRSYGFAVAPRNLTIRGRCAACR